MSQAVLLSQDQGAVRVLTLNRPDRLNALDEALGDALIDALAQAEYDPEVRAVVLTGAGRAFSAGADLAAFQGMAGREGRAGRERFTRPEFPRAFANFPKPLIAAVNGPAVGWGFTVSLMCDLRLAAEKAYFSAGFVKVGVTPEFGSSFLLPAIVGLGRALEMTLTARQVPAREALAMGLLSRVTPPGELMPAALDVAGRIAAHPPGAVGMAKALLRTGAGAALEQPLDYELRCFRLAMESPEHQAAVRAMLADIAAKKKG